MPLRKHEFVDGEELRRLRNLRGIKQTSVANTLGISRQAYSKIECCKKVGIKKALQILIALNCTISDLKKISQFIYDINS